MGQIFWGGQTVQLVRSGGLRQLERAVDELIEGIGIKIRRVGKPQALIADHSQAHPLRGRLGEIFDLAFPNSATALPPDFEKRFRLACALLLRSMHELLG